MSLPLQNLAGPASQMPALPAFDNTLGALLIGGLVATALWGVTCVQTFTFFTRKSTRRDSLFLKLMIALLWLLDTLNTTLDGHILYYLLVTNYLNPTVIMNSVWSIKLHVAITSISDFLIRTLFARRIHRLSKGNYLLMGWIMAVSMINLAMGIVWVVKAFRILSDLELNKIQNFLYLSFATGVTSDFSVTVALCWLLVRSRTGFKRTDTLINTLMLYMVNAGIIANIDVAICLITYITMPNNLIFVGVYLLQSKLYHNSYLATLNARNALCEMVGDPVSIHLSNISASQSRLDSALPAQYLVPEKGNHSQVMAISVNTYAETEDGFGQPQHQPSTVTGV